MSVFARVREHPSPASASMLRGVTTLALPAIAAIGLVATAALVATANWWAILLLVPTMLVGALADRRGRG